jgi:cysteine desulfurase/selenocysteine lyase
MRGYTALNSGGCLRDPNDKYIQNIGFDTIGGIEEELTKRAFDGLMKIPNINIQGSNNPNEHCGIISFTIDGVHPHDVSSILDADGIAVRAGHHCAQPLMEFLGVPSTTRASIYFYNTKDDIDAFLNSVSSVRRRMGYGK